MKAKSILLTAVLIFVTLVTLRAQDPPPPPPGGGHGGGSNQTGGAAPLGSGILLLISLGVGYGVKKIYSTNTKAQQ